MLGRFITIEGIDGAGKSTQTESSSSIWPIKASASSIRVSRAERLWRKKSAPCSLPTRWRRMLKRSLLAARADHVRRVIRPTLESGRWVLSDRFTDATYAYQVGGKGFSGEKVEALENWTLGGFAPDLTLLFDIAPAVAAARCVPGPEIRIISWSYFLMTRFRCT